MPAAWTRLSWWLKLVTRPERSLRLGGQSNNFEQAISSFILPAFSYSEPVKTIYNTLHPRVPLMRRFAKPGSVGFKSEFFSIWRVEKFLERWHASKQFSKSTNESRMTRQIISMLSRCRFLKAAVWPQFHWFPLRNLQITCNDFLLYHQITKT